MLLPTLCSLLLGSALAKPGLVGKQDLQPLPGARDGQIETRQIEPMALLVNDENAKVSHSLSAGYYSFASPNYTINNYPNDYFKEWVISGDQGQVISVNCNYNLDFDVEYHPFCSWDFLSINGVKYCNGRLPPNSVSSTQLTVVFKTDSSVTGRGFFCLLTVPEGSGTTAATTATTTTESPSGDQCCGVPNRDTRIVGGEETLVNEYPWQAALVSNGQDWPWCGGTLINTQWVMTAAHCTAGKSVGSFEVLLKKHNLLADSNQIRMSVVQLEDHPSYNNRSMIYDFSLLKLSAAIDLSSQNNLVAPACLPEGSSDFADVDAIVSGWGTTALDGSPPSALYDVTVQTMSNVECNVDMDNVIHSSMICADVDAGDKDSCDGDSGGPLVTDVSGRYTLIGVVSWGYGCADQDLPGVYSRMTAVSGWIATTTAGASLC